MAAVEMLKLNLAAMSYDKDAVLNALQRTGAAEIKLHSQTEYSAPLAADCDGLRTYLSETENALGILTAEVAAYNKQAKIKDGAPKEVEVSYTEFMSAGGNREQADKLVSQINGVNDRRKELESELAKVRRSISSARIYSTVNEPLKVEDTQHARFKLGTVPANSLQALEDGLESIKYASCSVMARDAESALILAAAHRSCAEELDAVMQSVGFANCPFVGEHTGEELYNSLLAREQEILSELGENNKKWAGLGERARELKIYCDYLGFTLEKAELSEKMRTTQTTFLLEAYVPAEAREIIAKAIEGVSSAVYYEFNKPSEDEVPPTLLKNNKVVENFEAITNMYSPPGSRELDPNTVMAFFYSVFLGFIMADIGYGLMMILGGGFLWLKNGDRKNMIGRLGGVFAIGGIFTIVWGFLFNSFFGFALLPFKVMPDLQGTAMSWSISGIKVPALLIISMLIGVVQLGAGYVLRAVQCFRRGQIADAVFDGIVWAVFSLGVELAIIGFVEEFGVSILCKVGGITAGVSLLTAVLTAGRKEKLLGKFTKGFGSAYGVINYASDILSYARLYGLMLAGAVIADIISSNSVSLISSGNFMLIILGVLIMVIGHVFNLAIGLLGAYIHDARLQYVEFYGRFYEGEGELFTPLGSKHKHVIVLNN